MPKGVERYVVPPWPRYGGGGEDESADVAGRQVGEGLERWKGAGRLWRSPFNERGAPLRRKSTF